MRAAGLAKGLSTFAGGALAGIGLRSLGVGARQLVRGAAGFTKTDGAAAEAPASEPFKLALCQLSVSDDKLENIRNADAKIREAAGQGAAVVVLPEMWNCPYSNDSFPTYAEDVKDPDAESPSTAMLSRVAAELSIYLVGGSIPEREQGRPYNTCFVYGPAGELLAKYRKSHLFDIDIPGKITFKESDTLTRGDRLECFDTKYGKIGVGICYDMRFPELAMVYASRGAQMIIYPGAFNMVTGPLHWQLLQQSRALDNQLFVASCSPARDEAGPYTAWGHSTVVGPFAEIVATTDHAPSIVYADVDFSQNAERRTNMPLPKQKRMDLYELRDHRNAMGFKF